MDKATGRTEQPLLSTALTPGQVASVWAGVSATAIGCSAWLLAMAGMASDWMAFFITLFFVGALVFIVGKMCLRLPGKRFPLLALLLVVVTLHCLAVYWWRFDLWRGGAQVSAEVLLREKRTVTFTIAAMVALMLFQFGLFYWLAARSRKNRARTGR